MDFPLPPQLYEIAARGDEYILYHSVFLDRHVSSHEGVYVCADVCSGMPSHVWAHVKAKRQLLELFLSPENRCLIFFIEIWYPIHLELKH